MERINIFIVGSFVVLLFCTVCLPSSKAEQWNQATKVSFNVPIEIPGLVLPAGTYWFTLMSDDPDRNIVQVWSETREHLLATILTVPDYRLHPTGHEVIRFEERPSTQPEALQAWFYPGDNYGHEFVYSWSRAREIARRTGRPVLSMRDDIAANITKPAKSAKEPSVMAMRQTQVQAMNPSGQEVDKSQAMQPMPQESQPTAPQH
jgi:hypothetical protein